MTRKTLSCAAIAAACAVALPATASASPRSVGRLELPKGELLPAHGGSASSLNWAGYAVTPSSDGITAVNSTFTVPMAGDTPPGFAATWTGIGGYSSSDLIQAGVAEQSIPTNPITGPQYYPWYELLPNSETQLTDCSGDSSCSVSPGDVVTVNIKNVSGNTWNIALSDAGHWSWSQDVDYASSESSAEWILEAPTVGVQSTLADTGTTHFGPTSTYTVDGLTKTIAQGDPTALSIGLGAGPNEAIPSALASDGESFDACAYASSCPAP